MKNSILSENAPKTVAGLKTAIENIVSNLQQRLELCLEQDDGYS